jgi:TolB protein
MTVLRIAIATLVLSYASACAETEGARDIATDSSTLKIAYNVLLDAEADNYEVFTMNLDGSQQQNISNWEGVDWVYASRGDKIYFLSDRDSTHRKYHLFEMDADGNNVRRISKFVLVDSWVTSRKEGTEFLVTSKWEGTKTFYLIDADGQVLSRVFSDTIRFNDACFSPDGEELAFRYHKSGVDEIWIRDVDGRGLRQLTHFPVEMKSAREHFYHAGPPFWEPNRNVISYISFQNDNYSIFLINPDGSGLRQLSPDGFNEGWHAWSPDGSQIVYDGCDLEESNFDIYLMNADGTNVVRLTDDPFTEQAPVFVRALR